MKNWLKTGLLSVACGLMTQAGQSQYAGIQSSGTIPEDFLSTSSAKSAQRQERSTSDFSTNRNSREFYFRSTFSLDRVLKSGRVTFNDPVTNYLNQVKDNILANEPELKEKIRIYTLKSTVVNAFADEQGVIMVTLGLLERLENEAQLAYILCHEIAHVTSKHSIESYVEDKKIDQGRGTYQNLDLDERKLKKLKHSREHEEEADEKGWERFKNSGYDLTQAMNAISMLQYTHVAPRNTEFDHTFLECNDFKIPDAFLLEETAAIEPNDEPDSLSTHPSLSTRIEKLQQLSAKSGKSDKGATQLPGAWEFDEIKLLAQREVCLLLYKNDYYEEAIYNCFTMIKAQGEDPFLLKIVGQSLYYLARHASLNDRWTYHQRYEEAEGPAQQLYHIMGRLTAEELGMLAWSYNAKILQQFPKDEDIPFLLKKLGEDLVRTNYYEADNLQALNEILKEETEKKESSTLFSLLQKDPEGEAITADLFMDQQVDRFYRSEPFQASIANYWDEGGHAECRFLNYSPDEIRDDQDLQVFARKQAENKMKKVLVLDPKTALFDFRSKARKTKTKFLLRSEANELELLEAMNDQATSSQLDQKLLDYTNLTAESVQEFNDMALTRQWFGQNMRHLEIGLTPFDQGPIMKIADRYDASHLYFPFTYGGRVRSRLPVGYVVYLYFTFIGGPIGTAMALQDLWPGMQYHFVFDVENGHMDLMSVGKDSKGYKKGFRKKDLNRVYRDMSSLQKN